MQVLLLTGFLNDNDVCMRVCERPSHQLVLQAISRFLTDFRAKEILLANPNFTEKAVAAVCSTDPLNHEVLNPY